MQEEMFFGGLAYSRQELNRDQWSPIVVERDEGTCVKCGDPGARLTGHQTVVTSER